jgi:hypothetical protein
VHIAFWLQCLLNQYPWLLLDLLYTWRAGILRHVRPLMNNDIRCRQRHWLGRSQ